MKHDEVMIPASQIQLFIRKCRHLQASCLENGALKHNHSAVKIVLSDW